MDSEIRAIMAQYMPLDNQNEVQNHVSEDRAWKTRPMDMISRNYGDVLIGYSYAFLHPTDEFKGRLCLCTFVYTMIDNRQV